MRARNLWAAAASAAVVASGLALIPASASASGPVAAAAPARVYAPYFETYLPDSVGLITKRAGVKYTTLAFVQSAGRKGAAACTLTWNGVRKDALSKGGYALGIKELQRRGGDAIVSFGGFSADQGGTEIADSCHNVAKIAAGYEAVVTRYGVHRLDMDIEARSLTNKGGIERRDQAIALLQRWAASKGIPLWIQFTLGVEPSGFDKDTLGILANAVKNCATVNSINEMVFDYYLGNEKKPLNMSKLALEAVTSVHRQIARIYPSLSSAQLWAKQGFTILPGIDDYPHRTETTSLSDARQIMNFAKSKGMDFLSIWALQRDDGRCPGAIDSNRCSGIKQTRWQFSHLLHAFTG